jgi:hypothetical protein
MFLHLNGGLLRRDPPEAGQPWECISGSTLRRSKTYIMIYAEVLRARDDDPASYHVNPGNTSGHYL